MEIELGKLREKIDSIDKEILELILKRMECVEKVGELKGKNNFRIYVPERENSIFRNLHEKGEEIGGKGKISQREIENIFTEIISFCRSKERKVKVYTEDYSCFFIARKIFGSCIDMGLPGEGKSLEDCDFKIVKLSEERYGEIFLEKIFKFIVSVIDFSGERYIILGKDSNGRGKESYTGALIFHLKEKKYEFRELKGFMEDGEIQREIKNLSISPDIEIKILGSYEKREIEG
ncbi:MAG: chorismate mutase [Fusobacteriaceae bacterium]